MDILRHVMRQIEFAWAYMSSCLAAAAAPSRLVRRTCLVGAGGRSPFVAGGDPRIDGCQLALGAAHAARMLPADAKRVALTASVVTASPRGRRR